MARTPLVLVHGGGFGASCWDDLVPKLRPPVLAVDLPGRGARPDDLSTVTLDRCADAVVEDIDAAGFDRVVAVGHSLAGATLPGIATRLGDRLVGIVFVACSVPPDGSTILDLLPAEMQDMAREAATSARDTPPTTLDHGTATAIFGNELTPTQLSFVLDRLVPEGTGLTIEPVASKSLTSVSNKTWIVCTKDAIVLPDRQREMAAAIGAETVDLDASHMAMVHRPTELAELVESARDRW